MSALNLHAPVTELTAHVVDVPSVSGNEKELADLVETALRECEHLEVQRDGDCVVAFTRWSKDSRVILAGHLDTVPIADNLPSHSADGILYGCGTTDMKSGVAVALRLAATITDAPTDLTYIFYDQEEIEADRNGLGRVARNHPDWLEADFAILLEPTDGFLEAGCQGSLRVEISTTGKRAHTARAWRGRNAIHGAGPVLERLSNYTAKEVQIDGLIYREGLQAVGIRGGVAGNVVPDACAVTVNYRYAPNNTLDEAIEHVRDVFSEFSVTFVEAAPGAPPNLQNRFVSLLSDSTATGVRSKLGWTDVARFYALGIPSVNFGPGDPEQAHTPHESVAEQKIIDCEQTLVQWLQRI